jgi:hypothetical protein
MLANLRAGTTAAFGAGTRAATTTAASGSARVSRGMSAGRGDAFALGALARELARAADRFGLLASAALGRLLVVVTELHLTEKPLALHLLLESLQRLINIVVANKYLQTEPSCQFVKLENG